MFQKTPNVALFLATNEKAGRDKFQGVLRYMRLHTPWNIHLVENGVGAQQLVNLKAWGVTGAIVARMPEALRFVSRAHIPTVVMDSPALYTDRLANTSFVTSDSEGVGRAAAEAFLGKGFVHFAYVPDVYDWDWSALRGQGFAMRLAAEGLPCAHYRCPNDRARKDWALDQKHLARWLHELPKPVAILAAHDARARQILETCHGNGLNVPGEVALLGVDDDEMICENTMPTLSSVQPDFEAGGYEAARLLEELMRGKTRGVCNICYGVKQVVLRESSRFAHAVDRRYLRGLEFIRLNAGTAITVTDIARHMGVSRRLAEMLFRKHVGHSILDEIQEVRLTRLKTFLSETTLPIGTITWQCGYQSENHVKRVFKQKTGLTMSQYRKQRSPSTSRT
ncbi:MAG: substrate-binding domain-containing protein [Lentisphaerae bacterium]|nr:substrate-binding domain-containing protein [Lentisphaerota bacterium]